MADNKVRYGASNARYALETDDGFGEWKRIPGIVNVQIEPQESQNDFYADNMVYFTTLGAASDQVTIEIADLTDEAKIDLLGYERRNGGLALPVNAKRKSFVFGFQVEGDAKALRINVFGGKLNRPSNTYETTTDSTEPSTMSIEGSFAGKEFVVDGENVPYLYHTAMKGDDDFDEWWDEVKTPADATEEEADATLSALSLGAATLSPAFDKDVVAYTAATTDTTNTVTATATDSAATVEISVDGTSVASGDSVTWDEGENVVTVTVTNGTATKTYTVTVTKS